MVQPIEKRSWAGHYLGQQVYIYDQVSSTNDLADRSNVAGTVYVAREQIAGRGQHGRVWQSHLGSSLLMSVHLDPPQPLRRPVLLTAWAAVAVAEAIQELVSVSARLKWPNDLFVNGKKVCGILIEQKRNLVLGLGLNLSQTAEEFAQAQLPQASSLLLETGCVVSPLAAEEMVLRHLDQLYARLIAGAFEDLETEWRWRIGLVGCPVVLEGLDGQQTSGVLTRLTLAEVAMQTESGQVLSMAPERVRHLWPRG